MWGLLAKAVDQSTDLLNVNLHSPASPQISFVFSLKAWLFGP